MAAAHTGDHLASWQCPPFAITFGAYHDKCTAVKCNSPGDNAYNINRCRFYRQMLRAISDQGTHKEYREISTDLTWRIRHFDVGEELEAAFAKKIPGSFTFIHMVDDFVRHGSNGTLDEINHEIAVCYRDQLLALLDLGNMLYEYRFEDAITHCNAMSLTYPDRIETDSPTLCTMWTAISQILDTISKLKR